MLFVPLGMKAGLRGCGKCAKGSLLLDIMMGPALSTCRRSGNPWLLLMLDIGAAARVPVALTPRPTVRNVLHLFRFLSC